jgi:hypothetical protein
MNKVMKIYILILSIVFTHNTLYSQFLKKIDSKDIEVIKESIPSKETGSRGYSTIEYNYIRVHKVTKKPLRGRYKVIIDKDEFYIAYFKKGNLVIKDKVNMVKYYRKDILWKFYFYFKDNYILLSKSNIDKDNIMRIQAFKNGDFDEKNAVNMYVSKNGVTEFLKTIMPAIKEKDIKEFLKDF